MAEKNKTEIVDQGPATYLMLDEIGVTLGEILSEIRGHCPPPDVKFSVEKEKKEEKKESLVERIAKIENDITGLNGKLDTVVSMMQKERAVEKLFDTGTVTLPNAVANVPDINNTTPATGYTVVEFEENMHRLSGILYYINLGPGPIYIRSTHDKHEFSANEISVFAGQRKVFNKISELRVRTTIADTQFIATEHPTDLIINNFDDRVATPAHILANVNHAGPSAWTIEAAYTVPTGYKAKVNGLRVRVTITASAVVPGLRQVFVLLDSPVVGLFSLLGKTIDSTHNALGYTNEGEIGYAYTLLTGETIEIQTEDFSTGGSVDYIGSVEITQYFSFPT